MTRAMEVPDPPTLTSEPNGTGPSGRRIFYGWYMAPIATLGMMCSSPGQTFGVAAFKPSFEADLGLSPSAISGAYMAGTLLAGLTMTGFGWGMDRFGLRRMMIVAVLGLLVACLTASQAQGLLSLFLAFLLVRMFGQGALGMLSGNTLALWFNRRLGLVQGVMGAGLAIAIAGANGLFSWLITTLGWRYAWVVIGVAVAVVMLPLLLLAFRDRPEDVGQRPDGDWSSDEDHAAADLLERQAAFNLGQAIRTRSYWIIAGTFSFWALATTAFAFCAPSIFMSHGLAPEVAREQVALMFFAMGVTLIGAQFLAGLMVDRLPMHLVLAAGVMVLSLTAGLLRLDNSHELVVGIGATMGVAQGMLGAVMATIWVRYYGRPNLGKIKGSLTTILVVASSAGPLLVDGMYDLMGQYDSILMVLMIAPAPLAVVAMFATRPGKAAESLAIPQGSDGVTGEATDPDEQAGEHDPDPALGLMTSPVAAAELAVAREQAEPRPERG